MIPARIRVAPIVPQATDFKISKSEDEGDFYQKVENVPYSHDSENFMKHSFDTFVWCCQK